MCVRVPVYLPARVAVDDGLGDGEGLVEIAKRVKLPLLALNCDVELLDTCVRKCGRLYMLKSLRM